MIKKLTRILLVLAALLFIAKPAFAQEKQVNIYFFWGQGCPHCEREKVFLEKLEDKYPQVRLYDYETWGSVENRKLFVQVGEKLRTNISGVPFTVVGEKHITGWLSEKTTGAEIEDALVCALRDGCRDVVGEILGLEEQQQESDEPCECEEDKGAMAAAEFDLPVVGRIDAKSFSLPLLTVVLGALDGFNPCAMWTLLFLISLLLGMEDKRRRWILGIAFIGTSAFVYFLFMAAWLNLLLFIGFIVWVRIVVALVALVGGGYNLREFFVNKDGGCKVAGGEKRQLVFEKLKNITCQKQFLIALGGIILLAFAVNLVELICSAGLPVVFTQILALSDLSAWQHYGYMLLYILVFMADDLFIFFMAMLTLEMTGVSTKYSRASHLIGGVLMIIVGALLIFKPEWLMFG